MPGLRFRRRLLPLAGVVVLAACSTRAEYVLEQGWGQLKMLNRRQRIERLLQRSELSPKKREMLRLVLLARQYADEEIGLRSSGAYTRFVDTGGRPLAHNLSACPKDSLRPKIWRFPVVGGLPYIGFFDPEEARRQQQELEGQGLDTYLREVSAFSSLGWFADPVYSPMLGDEPSRLVDLVIHETTHSTIFLRDQVAFNESLAVFIANQGTLNLLARLHGPASDEVARFQQRVAQRRWFSRLIATLYARLDALYSSALSRREKLARREQVFAWAQQRYRESIPADSWGAFVRRRLNNAVLLSYGRYNQGIEFHRRVYRRLGRNLRRMVELYKRAQYFGDPVDYVARSCGVSRFVKQRM